MKTKYIKVVFCFKFISVQSWWSKLSYQDQKTKKIKPSFVGVLVLNSLRALWVWVFRVVSVSCPPLLPLSIERGGLFSGFLPYVLQVAVFSRKLGTKETKAQSNWKLNYSRGKGTVALRSPSACTLVTFVCGAHVLGTQPVNNSTWAVQGSVELL